MERLNGSGRRVVCVQPSYLPWRGFFHLLQLADTFVFLDDVQYDKRSWRNRNRIRGPAEGFWITVPVIVPTWPPPPIVDIRIDNTQDWRRKHGESIQRSYAHAPFAGAYMSAIQEFFTRPWERLVDLDIHTTVELSRRLGMDLRWERSSALAVPGAKTERLVNLCRRLDATHYLSGPSARDYIEPEAFQKAGIVLEYMDYRYPPYPQGPNAYDPALSVIDLLFNVGSEAPEYIWGRRAREFEATGHA